jgi:hypothetical protein
MADAINSKSETNSNDQNTNPPKADKIQNKEDTDLHRINTVF